jgi:hypothetical protein
VKVLRALACRILGHRARGGLVTRRRSYHRAVEVLSAHCGRCGRRVHVVEIQDLTLAQTDPDTLAGARRRLEGAICIASPTLSDAAAALEDFDRAIRAAAAADLWSSGFRSLPAASDDPRDRGYVPPFARGRGVSR